MRARAAASTSWERAWHPVHPALKDHGPYIVVLVELPDAGERPHGRQPARRSSAGGPDRRARWRRCSSPTTTPRRRSRSCSGGEPHDPDHPRPAARRRRQRAQPLAPRHPRPRALAAHRPPGRPAEVLHGLGRLPRQRAPRPLGHPHRREVSRARAAGHHRRERGEVARVRGPPPGPAAHRRARGRGRAAPAGGRRSARAPARHGPRRHRRRGDLPQQGPRDVGHARSGVRDGPVPRLQRLGARDLRPLPRPHGPRRRARHRRPRGLDRGGEAGGQAGLPPAHAAVQAHLGRPRRGSPELQPAHVRSAVDGDPGREPARSPSTSRPVAIRAPRAATAAR